MKRILLGDTHFDANNSDKAVFEQQIKFFKEQLFPYMKENNITEILQLGDITDNRTKISLYVQHRLKEEFFNYLKENNINITILVGNHDIYYKTNRDIYSLEIFEKAYDNITVIKDLQIIDDLALIPWLCNKEDEEKLVQLVSQKPKAVFGHFELKDFYVSKTYKATHGLDGNIFKGIKVFSGHYHSPQKNNNINYIGTPFQDNWSSFGEQRGFYILDENLETSFIENTVTSKHYKVQVNSVTKTIEVTDGITTEEYKVTKFDYSILKNNKVKLFLDKDNAYNKRVTLKIIDEVMSYKIQILEETEDVEVTKVEDIVTYDIGAAIGTMLESEYQKEVYNNILNKSKSELKEVE